MIVLLGGTSETSTIALALAQAGYSVIVSMATDIILDTGNHPNIMTRRGRLDVAGLSDLIRERTAKAVVDATHPYAEEVHHVARTAGYLSGIPVVRFERPSLLGSYKEIQQAVSHDEAAKMCIAFKRPLLLTIGSRHLVSYVDIAYKENLVLIARVLPHPESLEACRRAGLKENGIVTGRGPFSVEQNRELIRKFDIGVIVTKESGAAGGFCEKIEAAHLEKCHVVVVVRPFSKSDLSVSNIPALLESMKNVMASS